LFFLSYSFFVCARIVAPIEISVEALVTKALEPFKIQFFRPFFSAFVSIVSISEPEKCSVIPKLHKLPLANLGKYLSFCF